MNVKKNRIVIHMNTSCDYCSVEWEDMDKYDWDTIYYDPNDESVICKACHKQYGAYEEGVI